MIQPDQAYPLQWPPSWPRCRNPSRAKFGEMRQSEGAPWKHRSSLTIAQARERLRDELDRLRASHVVISTNIRTRNDGLPYSNVNEPADRGVAVYFRLKGEPRVLACDKWDRVADNLAALAKHIEAVRGQVRWGVGSLEQAFGGYKALPAMGEIKHWSEVLGVPREASVEIIESRRVELLKKHHPDRGGTRARAAAINEAADQACRELAT